MSRGALSVGAVTLDARAAMAAVSTPMITHETPTATRLAPLLLIALSACSSVVSGGPGDGASDAPVDAVIDAPPVDAGSCALPNGRRCPRGATCPAGDGCNTCFCVGDSDIAGCTLIGCVSPDAGTGACRDDGDCSEGRACLFSSPGCGVVGTCGSIRDCAFLSEYCGCDGVTFNDCAGGAVGHPYASAGACPSTDGGTSPSCGGASIGPDGRSCLGPADGPLPVDCCTWNCDMRTSTCSSLPAPCVAGRVPTVVTPGCWGPCVAPTSCREMTCSSDASCVAPWRCDPATNRCVYGG